MDAMGRPPAGMMQGRLSGYGAYDQCLAIRHNDGIFQGKYCMVHLRYDGGEILPSVKTLIKKFADHLGFKKAGNISLMFDKEFIPFAALYKFGLCVPSLCEADDLQAIMDRRKHMFFSYRVLVYTTRPKLSERYKSGCVVVAASSEGHHAEVF
ncbi:hypothetical protein HPB51_015006 [Rhipicephalus microplus]|uniref:Nose resistant-to-fluoxetine protein N-terminal domain-containing protein n=1 Tax=Rhipicephalus microplus TaxID=6941 RepID=A0A9J6EHE9_RHIMP|nr:hypothetical protein HPB51_015006 [Rhipicephalus microplus]